MINNPKTVMTGWASNNFHNTSRNVPRSIGANSINNPFSIRNATTASIAPPTKNARRDSRKFLV